MSTTVSTTVSTTWLVYDPNDGYSEHDTEKDARGVFATVVDCLITEAEDPTGDGWLWLAVRVDRLALREVPAEDGDYYVEPETEPVDVVAALRALADQIADQREAARDERLTADHS